MRSAHTHTHTEAWYMDAWPANNAPTTASKIDDNLNTFIIQQNM